MEASLSLLPTTYCRLFFSSSRLFSSRRSACSSPLAFSSLFRGEGAAEFSLERRWSQETESVHPPGEKEVWETRSGSQALRTLPSSGAKRDEIEDRRDDCKEKLADRRSPCLFSARFFPAGCKPRKRALASSEQRERGERVKSERRFGK